jgi:hypothetical protein
MDRSERRFNDEDLEQPARMPPMPERPVAAPSRPASLWGVVLAGVAALIVAAALGFLMIPVAGVALAAAGIVFVFVAIAAFHYVVWGWWLSGVIREDVEAEERAEAEYERLRKR